MKYKLLILVLVAFFANSLYAQNLIVNGDFENPVNGFGFNVNGNGYNLINPPYTVSTSAGDYTFTSDPHLFNATSFIAGGDHTLGTGKMMVIDGNGNGGSQRFWRAGTNGTGICGLTIGKTYTFSYWIKSVSTTVTDNATRANIGFQFTNASNVLPTTTADFAPLPIDGWQKVSYTFKPTNACVFIELWNNNTSFVGNDFAVDDFSLVLTLPTATIIGSTSVCKNGTSPNVTFTGLDGVAPYTFTYNINGGANQTITTTSGSSVTLAAPTGTDGIFNYNLVSVSCGTTPVLTQNQTGVATITVKQLASATILGATSVCLNTPSPIITFTGQNGTAPYTFTYNLNGGATQTITTTSGDSFTLSVPTTDSGVFNYNLLSVSSTSTQTCSQNLTASALVNVDQLTATVSSDIVACTGGGNPTVTFTGLNGTPPFTFLYTINGGSNQYITTTSGNSVSLIVPNTSPGDYIYNLLSIVESSSNNCVKAVHRTTKVHFINAADLALTFFTGNITSCPDNVRVLNFIGTPYTTVNFNSSAGGSYSVILDAQGKASFTTPIINVTTIFTLVNMVATNCSIPLTGTSTVTIDDVGCGVNTSSDAQLFVKVTGPGVICNENDLITISANYFKTKASTSYTVSSIPYNPIAPFTTPNNAALIQMNPNGDDVYCGNTPSTPFTLPFHFCFYNNNYTQLLVGTNGILSFDMSQPLNVINGCEWNYPNVQLPNNTFPELNAIYGVYQDIVFEKDPLTSNLNFTNSNINYFVKDIGGFTAPNRVFIMNVNNVPQYPMQTTNRQTSQIVLYESTNVIDVVVKKRAPNNGWHSGLGVIGVQNQAGTAATVPPGRNVGTWSANNEAWRFIPSGTQTGKFDFKWYKNGIFLTSSDADLVVTAFAGDVYKAEVVYHRCDGTDVTLRDSYTVVIDNGLPTMVLNDIWNCNSATSFNLDQHLFSTGQFSYDYFASAQDVLDLIPITNITNYTPPTGTVLPKTIFVNVSDNGTGCSKTQTFTINNSLPASGTFSYPDDGGNLGYCRNSNAALAPVTIGLTAGGIFSITPATGVLLNTNTGVLDLTNATPGSYTINYKILATESCPEYNTTATIIVTACVSTVMNAIPNQCLGSPLTLTTTNAGAGVTYTWSEGTTTLGTTTVPTFDIIPTPTAGSHTYTVVASFGTEVSAPSSQTVVIHPMPFAAFTTAPAISVCTNGTASLMITGLANAIVTYTVNSGTLQQITLDASGNGSITAAALNTSTIYQLVSVVGNTTPNCLQNITTNNTVTISVGAPSATITAPSAICENSSTIILVTGTPNTTVTYKINNANPTTTTLDASGNGSITTGNLTTTTIYTFTDIATTGTSACSAIINQSVTVTVNLLPTATLTVQNATICSGTTATLIFTGTIGDVVTYNNGPGTADQTVTLTGATTTVVTPVLTANTTYELVSVANPTTTCSKDLTGSGSVQIAINPLTAITTQPVGTTLCSGTAVTFSVAATGTGLTYQWYKNNFATPVGLSSATATSYTIASPTSADAGNYFCKVSGTCGNETSFNAVLVIQPATQITTQPQSQTLCAGQSLTLTTAATGVNPSYQWSGPTGSISSATSATYTIASVTAAHAGSYTCTIMDTCQTVTTTTAVVTVNELPNITQEPNTPLAVCEGTPISMAVAATGTGLTYQWYKNNLATPVGLSSATATSYAIASPTVADAGNYFCVVTGTCPTPDTSNMALLTVNPIPTVALSGPSSICTGQSATITFTGTPNAAVNYTVNSTTVIPIVLDAAGTYVLTTPALTANVIYQITSVAGNTTPNCLQNYTNLTPNSNLAIVVGAPTATIDATPKFVCSGAGTTIAITGTPSTSFTYTVNGATPTSGTIDTSGIGFITTGNLISTTTYELVSVSTISTQPCTTSYTNQSVTVTVNPLPTATLAVQNATICSGTTGTLLFSGTIGDIVTYNDGTTNQTVTLTANPTSVTTPSLTIPASYTLVSVVRPSTGCSQNLTGTVTIAINPLTVIGTQPLGNIVCEGTAVTFSVVATGTLPLAYQWYFNTISNPIGASTNATSYAITSPTVADAGNYFCEVTGLCSTATSNMAILTVNPIPTVALSGPSSICTGQSATITFTGTPNAAVNYTVNSTTVIPIVLDAAGTYVLTTPALTANVIYQITSVAGNTTPNCLQNYTNLTPNSNLAIVVGAPTATIDATPKFVCSGAGTTIAITGTPSTSFTYTVNGATPTSGTIDTSGIGFITTGNLISTTTYELVSVSTISTQPCTTSYTNQSVTVTVNPLPTATLAVQNATICSGTTGTLLFSGTIGDVVTYNNGTTNQTVIITANPTPVTTASLTTLTTYTLVSLVRPSTTCSQSLAGAAAVSIDINTLTGITSQPQGTTLCAGTGTQATFSVVATITGLSLSYQWYFNTISNPIVGAIGDSYTINAPTVANAGNYFCVVKDLCSSATSNMATLIVDQPINIINHPQPQTKCEGESFTLSIALQLPTAIGLTYQWYHDGVLIPGATSTTYNKQISVLADSGDYYCVVKNSTCPEVPSGIATVIVNEAPKITTQPVPLSIICRYSPLNLVVETTGTSLNYQWYHDNILISGAISNVLSLTGQLTDSGNYICIVSSASCPAIISRVARVIVRDLPNASIANNGTACAICSGSTAEILFSGTPSAVVTYTINGGSNQTIVLNQAGTAILQTGILTSTAVYTLVSVASNDNPSCSAPLTGDVTITVIAMPRVSLDKDGYICIDSLTNTLLKSYLLDTGLDPLQYTFQWYKNNSAITTPILADQPSYEVKAIGTYKVAVMKTTTTCTPPLTCMREATAIITQSSPPEVASAEVVSSYFADNATIQITAAPMGAYEYALDYGPFQESSMFEGVETGTHIIHVRDLKACAEVTTTVSVIDYPKYFTPNGDGFHDTWNISALNNQPFAVIYIYDRAGKLLKQISTTGLGWDGTFNGVPLPADDYWFTINYTENGEQRVFKAHFAIKR
jgi:gliding motility-associated-like protein